MTSPNVHPYRSPHDWKPGDECERCGDARVEIARLEQVSAELHAVAKALILLHSGGVWTRERSALWEQLIGTVLGDEPYDATTRTLCNAARAAIAKMESR